MPATVTLSSTQLVYGLSPSDGMVTLVSATGITPGLRLVMDRELMTVLGPGVNASGGFTFNVLRGRDGTMAQLHDSGITVWVGSGVQFYDQDPEGAPPEVILVSHWINVRNGRVWFAQGDDLPNGKAYRWWQQQATTYDVGALGVRTATLSPTSST